MATTSGGGGVVASPAMARNAMAREEERRGALAIPIVCNDLAVTETALLWLVAAKNIVARQLPNMPKEYITRLIMDRRHRNLLAVHEGRVVGVICFLPFDQRRIAEVVFVAVSSNHQVKGYGTHMMNHLKAHCAGLGIERLLTYADHNAVGYFKKQGYSKFLSIRREQYAGYIKDYEGANLMECRLFKGINYLDIAQSVQQQKAAVLALWQQRAAASPVWPPLPKRGADYAYPIASIPGVAEAGWAPDEERRPSSAPKVELAEQLRMLLDDITEHASAWPFLAPVNEDDAPGYYDVIKDPIDLQTIGERIATNSYPSLDQFRADIKTMCDNCRTYNEPGTAYHQSADTLERYVTGRLHDLP